jgi:hypothetical protein
MTEWGIEREKEAYKQIETLRSLIERQNEIEAAQNLEIERLRTSEKKLICALSEEARKRGAAEGELAAAEWPGVIRGWREEVERFRRVIGLCADALSDEDDDEKMAALDECQRILNPPK